jgi:asparagine synthase (glutamine-hydrolysing)
MCGFAGVLTSGGVAGEELGALAQRMIAPIAHRGPDDSGIWFDEQAGVAFGFQRLAILDLSPQGHQPMASPSGRFTMVFNGEVYNFGDLRHQLEQRGYRFRGHSDTEVMLSAFEEWGIRRAIDRFIGMFAIAVWDAHRRELTLARDRMGKKPLYVYSAPGLIAFGSELKALFAVPSFDASIDREALASYLRYLYVPAPRTIFKHAIKVPPAHLMTLSDPARPLPAPQQYWSLRDISGTGAERQFAGTEAEAVDALDALLAEAVRCRLCSDVPLGALLSGGVDSSTVVALMQEACSRPVKTYTIGFSEKAFDEARHAALVARHLGTDHTELLLSGHDAQSLIPRLPEVFDEPFADPSQLPTLLVSQLARRHVTVALCGDGGDELFAGYNRHVYGTRVLPRVDRIPRALRRGVGAGIATVPPAAWDRVGRFAAGLVPGMPHDRFGERLHKIGHLMMAPTVGGMYRSLLSASQEPAHMMFEPGAPQNEGGPVDGASERATLLDQMLLSDQMSYLPDDLLVKMDRASMSVGLEVRAPILDQRIVEFSWRLPASLKLKGSVGKWILRQVLYRRVPRSIVDRPKMGFSVPIAEWLRGPLRTWGDSLLAPDALRRDGFLNAGAVAGAWSDLQAGRTQTGTALWAVLMFQAWRDRWQIRA